MKSPELRIEPADPAAPEIAALIQTHHLMSRAHYAVEDCHSLDADQMDAGAVDLFAAWIDGRAVGIGGLKPLSHGAVELKSMHTLEAARGKGVGAALLAHVIEAARDRGFRRMYLEAGRTDAYAAPARALYTKAGFVECPPFGDYTARPASIFKMRDLGADATGGVDAPSARG